MRAFGACTSKNTSPPQDPLERPGLVAARRLDRVAVHRVGRPHHLLALALHRADQRGQCPPTLSAPMRRSASAGPGSLSGLSTSISRISSSGLSSGRTSCRSDCSTPRRIRRARRRAGGCGRRSTACAPSYRSNRRSCESCARQRLLVVQQQRFVAGVEFGRLELRHGRPGRPAGRMKASASSIRSASSLIPLASGCGSMKSRFHWCTLAQVGITARGEGAHRFSVEADWR